MSSNRTDLSKMGKHIFELRKGMGYTQKQLGDILDVSDKTVSKWEQGSVAPDITILNSLASALNVSVNEILYGEKKDEKVTDDESVKMLSVYSEKTKHSLLKKIVVIFFAIVIAMIFMLYIDDYYKWNVIRFKIQKEFLIRGYIVSNSEESKVVLDDVNFITTNDDVLSEMKIKNIEVNVYYNKNLIFNKNIVFDNPTMLYKAFNNFVISFEENKKITKDGLSVDIKFNSLENEEYKYHFDF